ncbi:MAG TPA: histone deacetylase family protein [Burkholderiales bacterium]|nr:histone deacetylase family protein [Burkholderiales bacterium]
MPTALVHHRDCALHDMGSHHPECPARITAIEDHLLATGILEHLVDVDAPPATREQLLRVHDPDYVDAIEASVPQRGLVHLDPDTAMSPHSHHAALRAAGAVIMATDMVMSGAVENAFCNVRPPGHHAERARAMGFCFFNNVAVGAAQALEKHGLERVAVVDFDVHHGNGTEDIFRDDPRVMMVSTFQHPFYPYSGVEGRSERMVNIPLAAYSGGRQFREAVEKHWLPALGRFKPEMIFISAGFDAHRDDDMASLSLVESDYAWVTGCIKEIAEQHGKGRIVSTLEGGYELTALARSVAEHIRVLSGL